MRYDSFRFIVFIRLFHNSYSSWNMIKIDLNHFKNSKLNILTLYSQYPKSTISSYYSKVASVFYDRSRVRFNSFTIIQFILKTYYMFINFKYFQYKYSILIILLNYTITITKILRITDI